MAENEHRENKLVNVDVTQEQRNYVYENRRYVGRTESVGYVAWDMAQSFNINSFSGRFANNILQIDFTLQQISQTINGVWDIVNDIFTAAIVDKTRTRWGKFKPYLVLLAGPGTLGGIINWILPFFFMGTDPTYIPKFLAYLVLGFVMEGIGTFTSIAQGGLLSTISPHPVERTRLITMVNFWSGFLGEKLPEQLMTVLLDLVGNGLLKPKDGNLTKMYTKVFSGMGIFTVTVGGLASLWFNVIVKERVMQSIERPSIRQGIRSILTNRPILLLTASDILGTISISAGGMQDYYIEVLNFASMVFFAGIPGAIIHPFSYAVVPWFRRRFSTRFLYFYTYIVSKISMIPVFLFGSMGGMDNGMYKKRIPMGIALALQETVFMTQYGLGRVVRAEMQNEAMDFCEWKNGYRTEAMTSVAKGLAVKFGKIIVNNINLQLKKWIGYDQTRYIKGEKQSDKTQYLLFTSATILPVVSSILSALPMLFWNLNKKEREIMYAELLERRAKMANTATDGDLEKMDELARDQMDIANYNKGRKL